jgi:hypothetical protein
MFEAMLDRIKEFIHKFIEIINLNSSGIKYALLLSLMLWAIGHCDVSLNQLSSFFSQEREAC